MNSHYLAHLGGYDWQATDVVCRTDRGKYVLAASMDGQLWEAEFVPVDDMRIQPVASGLGSFDEAQMACAEHYAKLSGG